MNKRIGGVSHNSTKWVATFAAILIVFTPFSALAAKLDGKPEDYDTNGRSGLQQAEMVELCKAVQNAGNLEDFEFCLLEYRSYTASRARDKETYPLDKARIEYFKSKPVQRVGSYSTESCDEKMRLAIPCDEKSEFYQSSPGLFLRQNHFQFGLFSKNVKANKLGEGAQFIYQQDFVNSGDIISAQGSVMYPHFVHRRGFPPRSGAYLADFGFIPSISFHRVGNNLNSNKDIDSLTFRLASAFYMSNMPVINDQFFWLGATYKTDFDFDSGIWALEADWTPIDINKGIGTTFDLINENFEANTPYVGFYWQPKFHFEAGFVADPGSNGNFAKQSDFARFGPNIHAGLIVGSQLKFTADWRHYSPLIAGSGTNENMRFAAIYFPVPSSDRISVTASYERGNTELDLKDIDMFKIGLGIKF